MCSAGGAAAGASAGLQIAGGALNYKAQRQAFKDQKDYLMRVHDYQTRQVATQVQYRDDLANYQNELYTRNAEAVNADVANQYSQIQARIQQEDEAAALEIQSLATDARRAESAVVASAAERGIEGASVDALMADIARAEAEAGFTISRQLDFNRQQAQNILAGIEAQGQSRINSLLPQPLAPINMPAPLQGIRGPDFLSALLGTSSGVANTAGNYFLATGR